FSRMARSIDTMALSSSTTNTLRDRRSTTRIVEEDQRLSPSDDGLQRAKHLGIHDGADQIAQPLDGELRGHLFLVGSRGGEGVVNLHGSDDPGAQRNGIADEAVGVAPAVP